MFWNGYNYAYRIKLVNDTLYKTGIEYFERGISLIDVPERKFIIGKNREEFSLIESMGIANLSSERHFSGSMVLFP